MLDAGEVASRQILKIGGGSEAVCRAVKPQNSFCKTSSWLLYQAPQISLRALITNESLIKRLMWSYFAFASLPFIK